MAHVFPIPSDLMPGECCEDKQGSLETGLSHHRPVSDMEMPHRYSRRIDHRDNEKKGD